ncbi:MAG: NnrS family protein [Alphaproteobacteria bacterium]
MALFGIGFRPFFLLAGVYGGLAVPLSLAAYLGYGGDFTSWPVSQWHMHEMVYGYAMAVIAGFLLTAVPGWRKTMPVSGARLALLAVIWLAGRLVMGLSAWLLPLLVAAVDLAFIPALVAMGIPGLLALRDKRNGIFLVILGLFLAANGMLHFDIAGNMAVTLVVDLLALLVCILGGHIVPSFTRNALAAKGLDNLVQTSNLADRLAIGSVAAVVLSDLAAAHWEQMAMMAAGLVLAAAVVNGWRMAGWGARHILDNPIVWSLHLGYGWLAAGLALKGLGGLGLVDGAASLHGLTIGMVGTMTLAVMSRAALGHTGRPLVASPLTVAAYVLVSVAVLCRFAAAVPALTVPALITAAVAWTAAFTAFVVVFAPILFTPRPDGRPG